MDAGIIANFKHHYKKLAARAQLQMVIRGRPVRISPYDALCLCKKAWDAVTAQTIERCWFKTGIIPQPSDQLADDTEAAEIAYIDECIHDSLNQI